MIRLSHISKSYDGLKKVVDNLSMDVPEGNTTVLLGSSGCGKTTVMKMIARLEPLTSGTIELDGEDIYAQNLILLRRNIGYVFQHPGLFPHMSVAQNVGLILKLQKEPAPAIIERVDEMLEMVNLPPADYRDRFPHELSGGQQQRVGVARAMATNPRYLLMDEPFGALDNITRRGMQEEMKFIRDKTGVTVIFVTHDVMEAVNIGDQIAVMRAGKIEQLGTPEDILGNPQTDFVRELVSEPVEEIRRLSGKLLKGSIA